MRVQSAWALLSILRFCSELFSLLSGALMGFSTRRTLIMKTVEAASIHPSIAQEPLDSCRARLINGRHSRSLPFGAGRELEKLGARASHPSSHERVLRGFPPSRPRSPFPKGRRWRPFGIRGDNVLRGSNRIQERPRSVGPPAHEPDRRVPSSPKAYSRNKKRNAHDPPAKPPKGLSKNGHAIVHSLTIKFRAATLVVLTFQQQFGLRLFLPT